MQGAWNSFRNEYVKPLWTVFSDGILVLVVALLAARVLVQVPFIDRNPTGILRRKRTVVLAILSAVALVFAPYFLTKWQVHSVTATIAICLLAIAVGLLASRAAAIGKRILVTEVGSSDGAAATTTALPVKVAQCLEDLGTGPQSGLELPNGVDSSALNSSVIFGLANGPIDRLQKVIAALAGFTPWKVTVSVNPVSAGARSAASAQMAGAAAIAPAAEAAEAETDLVPLTGAAPTVAPGVDTGAASDTVSAGNTTASGRSYSISITRNGRTIHTYSLAPEDLASGTSTIPYEKMVAAAVLLTLAEYYRGDSWNLAGATDWRSVGWTYAAQGMPEQSELALLQRATQCDPGNIQARGAFLHRIYRTSDDPSALLEYAEWLDWAADRPELRSRWRHRPSLLALRFRYTATAVVLNAWRHFSTAAGTVKAPEDVVKRTERLYGLVRTADRNWIGRPCPPLVKELQRVSAGLRVIADPALANGESAQARNVCEVLDQGLRTSSTVRYNEACRKAVTYPYSESQKIIRLLDERLLQTESPIADFEKDPYLSAWIESNRILLEERRTAFGLENPPAD